MKEKVSKWKIFFIAFYIIIIFLFSFIYNPIFLKYNLDLRFFDLITSLRNFFLLALIGLPIAILSGFLSFKPKKINPKKFLISLIYIIIVSIAEELIFRGIVQNAIFYLSPNISIGLLISSLIFGLSHLPHDAKGTNYKLWNWRFALVAFVAGLFLGLTYLETASMINPIIVHFLVLLFSFILVKNN